MPEANSIVRETARIPESGEHRLLDAVFRDAA